MINRILSRNIQISLALPHQDIDALGSFLCLLDESQPPQFLKVITILTLGKSVLACLCFYTALVRLHKHTLQFSVDCFET